MSISNRSAPVTDVTDVISGRDPISDWPTPTDLKAMGVTPRYRRFSRRSIETA